jgi:hypothetical protein
MKRTLLFFVTAFLFAGVMTRGYAQDRFEKPRLMAVIIKAQEKHDQAQGDFKKLRSLLNIYLAQTRTPSVKPYPQLRHLLGEMERDMLFLDRAFQDLQRWSTPIHDLFEGAEVVVPSDYRWRDASDLNDQVNMGMNRFSEAKSRYNQTHDRINDLMQRYQLGVKPAEEIKTAANNKIGEMKGTIKGDREKVRHADEYKGSLPSLASLTGQMHGLLDKQEALLAESVKEGDDFKQYAVGKQLICVAGPGIPTLHILEDFNAQIGKMRANSSQIGALWQKVKDVWNSKDKKKK